MDMSNTVKLLEKSQNESMNLAVDADALTVDSHIRFLCREDFDSFTSSRSLQETEAVQANR